jgi:hypothetical protein
VHFEDSTLCHYHAGPLDAASWRAPLLAIGWLEHPHDFVRGTAPVGLVRQLEGLVIAAGKAHPHRNFRGLHQCSICEARGSGTKGLPSSHINMLIPGPGVIYAAPAGIVHHIEAHSYLPPSEFIEAVERCPDYGSPAFYEAVRASNCGEPPPLESGEQSILETRRSLLEAIKARERRNAGNV